MGPCEDHYGGSGKAGRRHWKAVSGQEGRYLPWWTFIDKDHVKVRIAADLVFRDAGIIDLGNKDAILNRR